MALLASSCAWLKLKQSCPKHDSSANTTVTQNDNNNESKAETEAECTCNEMKKIRIYYATRTHKQISQVVKEFERLPYGLECGEEQLLHTILASREQSCVNDDLRISDAEKKKDLNEACKDATDLGKCEYRNNLFKGYEHPSRQPNKLRQQLDVVKEFERLPYGLECGENQLRHTILASREQSCVKDDLRISDAEKKKDLNEACKDATDLGKCEYRNNLFKGYENPSRQPHKLRQKLDGIWDIEDILNGLVLRLFNFFSRLSHDLDSNFDNCKTKTWKSSDFLALFKNDDPERNLYFEKDDAEFDKYLTVFERITRKNFFENEAITLPTPVISLIQNYFYFMKYFQIDENKQFYKCNITFQPVTVCSPTHASNVKADDLNDEIETEQEKESVKPKFFRSNFEASLNFWCMSPSVAFMDAFNGCHSVILASGTLSPMASLKTELGLKFELEMKGVQGIPEKQIFAAVVSKSSSGYQFKCTYENTQNEAFYSELLKTILDVCKTVPKGILVFVSSYRILDNIRNFMKYENLEADIEKHKKIFYEPNQSKGFKEVFDEYTFTIQNTGDDSNSVNGSILFGVFRGKISEGIDFPDDMARCVICVGIPLPNFNDEQVKQKRAFNDSSSMNILSGEEWYSIQAYRALNQALGRCLRHRNDWGAILLFDNRFLKQGDHSCPDSKTISSWVRPLLWHYNDHPSLMNGLAKFVDERKIASEIQLLVKEMVNIVDDDPLNTPPSI
uniref:ATP-dependent helicase C-terminal domain-containing protein n=1 Tax=Panagrolaimus sp. ES5 TaxID=591445 RepID=A0AC34FDJ4_9BILA